MSPHRSKIIDESQESADDWLKLLDKASIGVMHLREVLKEVEEPMENREIFRTFKLRQAVKAIKKTLDYFDKKAVILEDALLTYLEKKNEDDWNGGDFN